MSYFTFFLVFHLNVRNPVYIIYVQRISIWTSHRSTCSGTTSSFWITRCWSRPVFLKWGQSGPAGGHLSMSADIFGCHN